jgi:hypothetical protein
LQASAARKPKTPHFIAANLSLQYSEDEVSESDDALPEAWERLRIYPYTKEEIVNDIRLNNADNPFCLFLLHLPSPR